MSHDAEPLRSTRTRWSVAALYGLVGGIVIAVLVMAFVWPAATSKPQNLPVGISGPTDRVAALETALAEQDPAPFTLTEVDSRDDAVAQIESRELYGAILLDGPEVLVATAASPVSAQALRGVATQLQAQIDRDRSGRPRGPAAGSSARHSRRVRRLRFRRARGQHPRSRR